VEDEREKVKSEQDEADVEGHRVKPYSDDAAESADPGRRESEDGSDDVEAHRFKA
jgi:hypothetical protein